jgi:hypothetical protein
LKVIKPNKFEKKVVYNDNVSDMIDEDDKNDNELEDENMDDKNLQ